MLPCVYVGLCRETYHTLQKTAVTGRQAICRPLHQLVIWRRPPPRIDSNDPRFEPFD